MKLKSEILISKDLQKEIKGIMRDARKESIDLEPNEGVDYYYDEMRRLKFTEDSARTLLAYAKNTEYVEGESGVRPAIKPGWLPVMR